ncbi:MAG: hypothetical protein P1V36_13820 [Planctomycetota bacterium]|nr:hypothetical protein [Planctomycetota bacterium]
MIGTVTVERDGPDVVVTFDVTADGWSLTKTHLYVGADAPTKAAPGRFPYQRSLDHTTQDIYRVPAPAGCFHVAAHADAKFLEGYTDPNLDEVIAALPATATMRLKHHGGDSYFDTTITDGELLDGLYDGFCVDAGRSIRPGRDYTVEVYSSYDPSFATLDLVDRPENMDLVNWVINQDFTALGYTYGDIQKAIWTLIDDKHTGGGLGSYSQARVDEIVAMALIAGVGFVPGCDQQIAIVLRPVGVTGETTGQITIAQVTFVQLEVECMPIYRGETAWGFGDNPFRTGWGWSLEVGSCGVIGPAPTLVEQPAPTTVKRKGKSKK